VIGVKEACGDIVQIAELARLVGDRLAIWSGNDDQIVPILALGGRGVITVLGNVAPRDTSRMVHAFLDGDVGGGAALQLRYLPLIRALFAEPNPIPVKTAVRWLGFDVGPLRAPLCAPTRRQRGAAAGAGRARHRPGSGQRRDDSSSAASAAGWGRRWSLARGGGRTCRWSRRRAGRRAAGGWRRGRLPHHRAPARRGAAAGGADVVIDFSTPRRRASCSSARATRWPAARWSSARPGSDAATERCSTSWRRAPC
jgi:hypothetical protein